jgi:hypothetical protein
MDHYEVGILTDDTSEIRRVRGFSGGVYSTYVMYSTLRNASIRCAA